jgi:hypothetical protein
MARTFAILVVAVLFAATVRGGQAAEGFFSGDAKAQAAASTSGAPTLADLDAAEKALADLWTRLPFTTRHVMFVTRKADLLGDYEQRPSNVFTRGEPLLTYLEPVGYGWKPLESGIFGFGVTTDFEVLTADGKVLGGQKAFQKVDLTSHVREVGLFVNLTLTIDGVGPGNYVLAYTLHDNVSGRTTRVEQPFTIKASN